MKYTLSILISFLVFTTLQAQERGVTPVSSSGGGQEGTTYAVVVSISDYQKEMVGPAAGGPNIPGETAN